MKYTGWAVLLIGVLIAAYGLFTLTATDPTPVAAAGEPGAKPFPIGYVLLPFAGLAVSVGLWMILSRGSGVIKTKNLAVRN